MNDNPNIRAFDSIEAAFDFMETNVMEANEQTTEEQRGLADGEAHYFLSVSGNLVMMGRILSEQELLDGEKSYYDMGKPEDVAEFEWTRRNTIANRERGIVMTRAFSIVTPTGELGSKHVVSMAPASLEAFNEFMAAGCRCVGRSVQPHLYQVIEDIIEKRRQRNTQ